MHEAFEILKKYWEHDSFRPPQLDIIKKLLSQRDALAVLPTGSGKSVIYQVAGMLLPGVTLVISPLVALIEDQLKQLEDKKIKAIALTGGLSFQELERLLDNAAYGNTKFLFLSPERLQNRYVQKRIAEMSVNLIVIDEAHCISEWGHDFRPQYLKISILRKIHEKIPVLALTATAKERVINDIVKYLELKTPAIYKTSVFRNNIAYKIYQSEDKIAAITSLVAKDDTSIVYVRTRKQTYRLAELLRKKAYTTSFFHGGMNHEEKQQSLKEWKENKKRIMVATNAFGMGIDKPDVRKVLHYELPNSLENYVQESGRAGRDGAWAEAIILLADYDLKNIKNRNLNSPADLKEIKKIYDALYGNFHVAEGGGTELSVSLNLADFCKRYQLSIVKTYAVLQMFDSESIIELDQNSRRLSGVQILYRPENLRYYIKNRGFGHEVLNVLVRTYANIFHFSVKINFRQIAEVLSITQTEITDVLKKLSQRKIIDFRQGTGDLQIRFLLPKDKYIFQAKRKHFQNRMDIKRKQLQAVVDYVENEQYCRSRFLTEYFEEQSDVFCGICDICMQKTPRPNREISKKILSILSKNCMSRKELERELGVALTDVLQKLMENNKIFFDKNMKYCIK